MTKTQSWINAIRPRTLPLSLSGILVGLALSPKQGRDHLQIVFGCIITTILFQILSNLANDLGDSVKGTDNANRVGPVRAIQSGAISVKTMIHAVWLVAILSLCSAIFLIYSAYFVN